LAFGLTRLCRIFGIQAAAEVSAGLFGTVSGKEKRGFEDERIHAKQVSTKLTA